jgi:hypothetical protein
MTAKNDVTGDLIKSKTNSNAYSDGWDRIFGKKKKEEALDEMVRINQELGLYDDITKDESKKPDSN